MNNKLFTAILLTFSIITCLTNANNTPEPTKAELLAQLQNVKKDINTGINALTRNIDRCKKAYGEECYLFLLNMITEVESQLKDSPTNKCFNEQTLEETLQTLCNDTQQNLFNIIETNMTMKQDYINPCLVLNKQDKELIQSIINKHHQQYCQKNPNSVLTDIKIDTSMIHLFDFSIPFSMTHTRQWYIQLLEKVDAKIIKLEQQ